MSNSASKTPDAFASGDNFMHKETIPSGTREE